jgi:hypothetical protein
MISHSPFTVESSCTSNIAAMGLIGQAFLLEDQKPHEQGYPTFFLSA